MSNSSKNLFTQFIDENPNESHFASVKPIVGAKEMEIHPAKLLLSNTLTIQPKSPGQQKLMAALLSCASIVVADGPAGVGKTFLACIAAIIHKELGLVKKIYFARPTVDEGEGIGFVPGGMYQKMAMYMRPMLEVLVKLGRKDLVQSLKDYKGDGEKGIGEQIVDEIERELEFVSLAQLMGRDLQDAFIILDETQLADVGSVVTAVTRQSKGSRLVICGDLMQGRGKNRKFNGMHFAVEHAKNTEFAAMPLQDNQRSLFQLNEQGITELPENDEIIHVKFSDDEIRRHAAVMRAVKFARTYMKKHENEL